ncbi:diphthamide biosynthesis protein [Sodiomyces alkalinus F11]|uniref:2-(3-amino-3-carboxypropyl)histidine synthase subunit 2 n=1 Tax=Sodiomyces alkalinus (strain CBS 110278 / VKM F-3762 / F11) TaxID=1314773 RepID=A0A3N2PPW8_SODAK|nr:diphthamide biosynthesis protein [Sodiomyces alkalinus F11]ROT36549.1 diphthamide biosynthesis protein [Sodiomyces alkalinus F11]
MSESETLSAPPVLSTPAEPIFEDPTPTVVEPVDPLPPRTDDELHTVYEIRRTAREIKQGGWKRIGLQFPDPMLRDAGWVVEALSRALAQEIPSSSPQGAEGSGSAPERIYVLADTSYSACCVDEIAAEHADAQVVVHYGRACLSPTSRLPVIYVFTQQALDLDAAAAALESQFPDPDAAKVVLMADITYQDHVEPLASRLRAKGYRHILRTAVVHNPAGVIPNRRLAGAESESESDGYSLFHISTPPSALLLALHSRFASLHVLPAPPPPSPPPPGAPSPRIQVQDPTAATAALLRRRFARVLTLASAGVVGILVNTLSVANYLSTVDLLRRRIADAGKKSYTVVVGKLNPAKLANFAEIDGWVVVGCWESGLVEDDAGFYRPVVTPFELEVALRPESERVWGPEWWGGMEKLEQQLQDANQEENGDGAKEENQSEGGQGEELGAEDGDGVDGEEEESAPPAFDLRTGKLISHSRPMRVVVDGRAKKQAGSRSQGDADASSSSSSGRESSALVKTAAAGELATINGVVSPGAEFLRSKRTWQGLGTDFDHGDERSRSAVVEEGRSGVARGYTVGEDSTRT